MKLAVKQIVSAVGLIGLVSANVSMADDNQWLTGVKVYGLVQVEAQYHQDYEDTDTSDIVVDEMDFGIEARVNKWAKADIIFIYEEDGTPLGIDEAFLTLGNTDESPLYMAEGQMYVPVGNFERNMLSDHLTVDMAETRPVSSWMPEMARRSCSTWAPGFALSVTRWTDRSSARSSSPTCTGITFRESRFSVRC